VEIAQLDPMLVYFYVPYVERQRALDKVGTFDADEAFGKSRSHWSCRLSAYTHVLVM
jgi:hypothetical protein